MSVCTLLLTRPQSLVLGAGSAPVPVTDGECLHPSRQMPTPPVVEQKGQREGRVYVLEETVEAAAALNGAFFLLRYGMEAFMCI